MTEYHSLSELKELSIQQGKEMWEIVLQAELDASERTAEESFQKMLQHSHLKITLALYAIQLGGLVEVPCIKRNAYGAVNAVASSQLAMAGIRSAISPDDVIDSMKRIGNQMPACLKETSQGGLAITESARNYINN